jgi:NAD kinase
MEENKFMNPFILFRRNNEKAKKYFHLIVNYLILKIKVKSIYLMERDYNDKNLLFQHSSKEFENKFHPLKINNNIENDPTDICINIGGDGHILYSNYLYNSRLNPPPFLNFYIEKLGFLTIYPIEQYEKVLDNLYKYNNNYFEKHSLVNCIIYEESIDNIDYKIVENIYALNEIVIGRGTNLKMIGVEIYLNNEFLTKVNSDGLVFSTSTGSSGYNISSGGPLMHFEVDGIIFNAICPFSLSFRPIIFPKKYVIKVKLIKNASEPVVINDMIATEKPIILKDNQFAEIKLSNKFINFIIVKNVCVDRMGLWKKKVKKYLGYDNN